MSDVVELIGNPRTGSRTRALADVVTDVLVDRLAGRGIRLTGRTALELGELVTITLPGEEPRPAGTGDPLGAVRQARLLIAATPTYKGTYTGLLKVLFDRLKQDELAGAVGIGVAIAASEDHRRSVGAALHALLAAVGASVPAEPVALLETEVADADRLVVDWADKYAEAIADALGHVDPAATPSTVD